MGEDEESFNEFRDRMNERILSSSNLQVKRFFNLDNQAYEEGKLDKDTKEMLGLVASMVLKCDDCIKYHLQELYKLGLEEEKLWEVFNIALVVGGSIVIPHLREAVDFWDDLNNDKINFKRETEKGKDRQKNEAEVYEVYTDGACTNNPGPGGYAALVLQDGELLHKVKGNREETTNNRMELIAVIEGLEILPENCKVRVYTDSQYVNKGLKYWLDNWKNNDWKTADNKSVKNKDLWRQLDDLRKRYNLEIFKVEAHSDNELNNKADDLAKEAIPRDN